VKNKVQSSKNIAREVILLDSYMTEAWHGENLKAFLLRLLPQHSAMWPIDKHSLWTVVCTGMVKEKDM